MRVDLKCELRRLCLTLLIIIYKMFMRRPSAVNAWPLMSESETAGSNHPVTVKGVIRMIRTVGTFVAIVALTTGAF
jgi:hypothetical protein